MKTMLTRTGTRLGVLALTALTLITASAVASAQASRTWVSGVGDDVNPCSRTAPCKTWSGAIAKTAAGGEIDALDPGGFGAVTITKAITLDGGGGQVASVLIAGTNGIIVTAGVTGTVILRNLRINGLRDTATPGLSGVLVLGGTQVTIENTDIFGFSVAGVNVTPAVSNPVNVSLDNTRVINNLVGVSVDGTNAAASVRLSNSTILQNTTGLSTTGGGSIVSFNNNRLNGNGTDGVPTQTIYQR